MDIVCPACRKKIPSSILQEGQGACPYCKRPLETAGAPANPRQSGDDLFADLMAETRRSSPARSAPVPVAQGNGQALPPPPPRPRPARARVITPDEASHRHRVYGAVALGAIAVLALGCFAVVHIRRGIQRDKINTLLQQVEFDKTDVEQRLSAGDKARDGKNYGSAASQYEQARSRASTLLASLRDGAPATLGGTLKASVDKCDAELSALLKRASDALESPEIKYGSKGMIPLDDGTWGTPEQKQALFEAKMKAQGRTKYEPTGEWLTEDEIWDRKGYVLYNGQRVTKEERDRLLAAAAAATRPTTATPVAPPPVVAPPRPPATASRFDPASSRWLIDDFESGSLNWSNVSWNKDQANPCTVALEKRAGSSVLAVTMQGGPKDKSAIVRAFGDDLSSRSKLVFDLDNATGGPINVAVAVETTVKPYFYESRWFPVRTDKNELKIDLRTGDFKSSETNWTHSTQINGLENARVIYILFYTDRPGKLYLDNIVALGQ